MKGGALVEKVRDAEGGEVVSEGEWVGTLPENVGEVGGGEAGREDESGERRVEGHAERTDVFGGGETALGVYKAVRVRRVGGCGRKDG